MSLPSSVQRLAASVELRPYQLETIARVRAAMAAGHRRVLIVSPTGSGKTLTCAEISRRVVAGGKRVLWLSHRAELIEQSADTLTALGLSVGGRCATASTPPNPFAPVQVASVQTLLARNLRPEADVIIADEAHHFGDGTEEWTALLKHYTDAWVIGATATPQRGDGAGLRGCFDALVVGATVRELTDLGHLVPCEIMRPAKPLAPGELARNPVDAYVEHAAGRRAVVFVRSVPLAEEYAQEFKLRGIAAACVQADTPWSERRLYLDAFKRGDIQVLVNVYVLTEGFDDPGVSCCIVARGCGAAGMWLQMIGRTLRPASGKTDALVLDLRGVSWEHGRPEDDREYSLDGRGIRLRDPNSYCPVCGVARTPPDPCEACDYAPSGEETGKPDKVTGDPLVKYAAIRREDDPARIARLARWIETARVKGYKDGWFKKRFEIVYGQWPTGDLIAAARDRGAA